MKVEVIDLEFGQPTVREAGARLMTELVFARRRGVRVLKLIHGYGSSGRGGKLRKALRRMLHELEGTGSVRLVVIGEAWSIFDQASRTLMDRYPELRNDLDLDRANAGITLVEL